MRADDQTIRLLLISDHPGRVEMIRRLLQQRGPNAELRSAGPGRRNELRTGSRDNRHDLVLFDFSDPRGAWLENLAAAAFDSRRDGAVIVLTSTESERLLSTGPLAEPAANLFEPTSLCKFFDKMREHDRNRFLGALAVIGEFGPVLVRLPGYISACRDNSAAPRVRRTSAERKVA